MISPAQRFLCARDPDDVVRATWFVNRADMNGNSINACFDTGAMSTIRQHVFCALLSPNGAYGRGLGPPVHEIHVEKQDIPENPRNPRPLE